jgi:hypothetical protein
VLLEFNAATAHNGSEIDRGLDAFEFRVRDARHDLSEG